MQQVGHLSQHDSPQQSELPQQSLQHVGHDAQHFSPQQVAALGAGAAARPKLLMLVTASTMAFRNMVFMGMNLSGEGRTATRTPSTFRDITRGYKRKSKVRQNHAEAHGGRDSGPAVPMVSGTPRVPKAFL